MRYGDRYARFLETAPKLPMVNYIQPSASNMWTGFELKKSASVALTSGILAWGIGSAISNVVSDKASLSEEQISRATNIGNMPSLGHDAVASAVGGQYQLGATGDLVFGLHNSRKGR